MKHGLVLAKYGDMAASTRQRLLGMQPYFAAENIKMSYQPLFENDYLQRLNQGAPKDRAAIAKAYLKRAAFLLKNHKQYDFFWIHCEVFPYLFGHIDALLTLTGKPIFMEFDDAIFHQYDAHPNRIIRRLLGKKLQPLLRKSRMAICGNAYLQSYCEPFCQSVIIPTVVDAERYQPCAKPSPPPTTLGWIGSPSTWVYCQAMQPLFEDFISQGGQMIAVGAESSAAKASGIRFKSWSEAEEVSDIQSMDIGIMPLRDDVWARGKCGYKLIQYMACGLPVIASPVGVNSEIVEHGVNGFLASTPEQWREAISKLSADAELRARMGKAGREKMQKHYSFQAMGPKLAQLASGALA